MCLQNQHILGDQAPHSTESLEFVSVFLNSQVLGHPGKS